MPSPELIESVTAEQVLEAIHSALKTSDLAAVAKMLPLLAVKDPDAAQAILNTLDAVAVVYEAATILQRGEWETTPGMPHPAELMAQPDAERKAD